MSSFSKIIKTASPASVGTATDVASWGGYGHARLITRLSKYGKPNSAPPDLAQINNILLVGTKDVASVALPQFQTTIAGYRPRTEKEATQLAKGSEKIVNQLKSIATLPPVPTSLVWQDMPFGKGLYLVEQPWYRGAPPAYRQVMQAMGMERSAASFSGFSGAPNDPVFDVALAERLQSEAILAQGEQKVWWHAALWLMGGVTVAALGLGASYYMFQAGANIELSVHAADERDRRENFQETVRNHYGPMLETCRRMAEEGRTDVGTCTQFLPPLEMESSLASWQAGTSECGWGNCATYVGIGAAVGLALGIAAVAKYTKRIPRIEV